MSQSEKVGNLTSNNFEASRIWTSISNLERHEGMNWQVWRNRTKEKAEEWSEEGFSEPLSFVREDGSLLLVARFEDEDLYDDRGLVRQDVDVTYRFFRNTYDAEDLGETREVIVPHEFVEVSQSLLPEDMQLYDMKNRAQWDEFLDREDCENFFEDLQWLRETFGEYLATEGRKAGRPWLNSDEKVVGLSLEGFTPFAEGDIS